MSKENDRINDVYITGGQEIALRAWEKLAAKGDVEAMSYLGAALASPRLVKVEIHPQYELLLVHLKRGGIPLRFYMSSELLEPWSLGSYVWTVRRRKVADDSVDYRERNPWFFIGCADGFGPTSLVIKVISK